MKKSEIALEKATKNMSKADRDKAFQAYEDVGTNLVKGMVRLEDYTGSDLNLSNWRLTAVLDDILMCQFVDTNEDGTQIMRGGIFVPILAGPRAKVKPGQHVIFPSTFGLKASNINNLRHIVFLNEDRIFGVAEPEDNK
jgi:hypothetical protein